MSAAWWPLDSLASRPADVSRVISHGADGVPLTHADFVVRTTAWFAGFARRPETQWAIYHEEPFEFLAAIFAAWHAGKSVAIPGDELPHTVAALRAAGYRLAGTLPGADLASSALPSAREGEPVVPDQALEPDATQLTIFTSGSGGEPVAIAKVLRQLMSEVAALETAFGHGLATDEDGTPPRVWATVSHQHIYGLLFLLLWPVSAGRAFGQQRLLYPDDLARRLGGQPSVLVTTPAHLKRLDDTREWQPAQRHLRAVFSSGGPLSFDTSQLAAATLGRRPIEVFGSSETGGIAWRQSGVEDTPWTPLAGVLWRLDGQQLAIFSPWLPTPDWWTTTDLAEASHLNDRDHDNTSDNSFRLLGRMDRIVKIEENRVSLGTIEQGLMRTEWVAEARALAIDTPIGRRMGVVAVLTAQGTTMALQNRQALVDSLRQSLAPVAAGVALPRRWRFVDAMPINSQGKSTDALMKALFMAPPPRALALPNPERPAVQWLERSNSHALLRLTIDAGLSVFKGHFDAAPILPGVAQVDWALGFARDCFALPDHFLRLEALKFVQPVVPGTALYLALQFKPALTDARLCSVAFQMYSLQNDAAETRQPHAGGRAVWAVDGAALHA